MQAKLVLDAETEPAWTSILEFRVSVCASSFSDPTYSPDFDTHQLKFQKGPFTTYIRMLSIELRKGSLQFSVNKEARLFGDNRFGQGNSIGILKLISREDFLTNMLFGVANTFLNIAVAECATFNSLCAENKV